MDRISQLPDCIVHHILSFFETSPADLVRVSVLSKNWFHLTASFPVLDFNIRNFRSRESFFKYVEYTTSRFYHQNATAHKFELKFMDTLIKPAELDIVDRCLGLVLKNGVKRLVIKITNSSESPSASVMPKYRLPNILLSVSVLEYLNICGCDLPSSLKVDVFKLKSFVFLELADIHLDEEMIDCLVTSCPLLKVFQIHNCLGFKRFCVRGHLNLRHVYIHCNNRLERIDIEAPNLSSLFIVDYAQRGAPRMNLASCNKLTTVAYIGHPLPNSNKFTDFLSNFPYIEKLFLATTHTFNNLKVSSHSLRTLLLHSFYDFEDIEFSTPNLASFSYPCDVPNALLSMVPDKRWPLLRNSTHLKACMRCYRYRDIDTIWFQKLRRFLESKNGFKVLNLYIHAIYSQKFTDLEKLKTFEGPPYELEHVELQLETHEAPLAHIAFVDAVLWCCRPRSLTLRTPSPLTDFEEQSDVVKFTKGKLLHQEDQGRTNIQIVSPSSSFLLALSGEGKAISFIKEEVVQEEAG